jgi:DNA-binding MarR family transcriptional regulator
VENMDAFVSKLNDFLVDTFHSILDAEEAVLQKLDCKNLSISELHLIEVVGKMENITISDIAQSLGITLPSVTVAINKLMNKGYVKKIKSQFDGRSVYVALTELGDKINKTHAYFHKKMVESVAGGLDLEEREKLLAALNRLNSFFKMSMESGMQ